MTKLVDAGNSLEYYEGPQTWLVEPEASSEQSIQAELAKIPSSAPVGSLAEVLISTGLSVYMKNSQSAWIKL